MKKFDVYGTAALPTTLKTTLCVALQNTSLSEITNEKIDMLRISMLLSCIFMTNTALDENNLQVNTLENGDMDFDNHAVTCYICVNVSDNLICNQFAIDRPCKPGETFCHTLHIMDSKGTSVLVNKKCTTEKECQRSKVGCVEIDTQMMCVSCCDQNYCNVNVPTNSTNAIFEDKITRMRMQAKNLFKEREKALTTAIKNANKASRKTFFPQLLTYLFVILFKNGRHFL